MLLRIKCSGQVHGMLSVWIRKDRITGHVRITGHFINRCFYLIPRPLLPGEKGSKKKKIKKLSPSLLGRGWGEAKIWRN
jgi:hypothetical protein